MPRFLKANRRLAVLVAVAVFLAIAGVIALVIAGPSTVVPGSSGITGGQLYFTTFTPPAVDEVSFDYQAGNFHLGTPKMVVRLPGADGLLFSNNGNLLVGGEQSGKVFLVNPSNGGISSISAGVPGSFYLKVSPDGHFLYTAGEPGQLGVVPLNPLQVGHLVPLHGADTEVTDLAFGPNGQVLYTSSNPAGRGDVGLIDLRTGVTHRLLTNVLGAHGIVYDPSTRSYIAVGGDVVLQLPSSDPGRIISELVLPGTLLNEPTVTGRGQVLLSSNTGSLVSVNFSTTGLIGNLADRTVERKLLPQLDDVAPLIGAGALPIATSASRYRLAGGLALAASVVLGLGLVISQMRRRARGKSKARPLPKWDRRR